MREEMRGGRAARRGGGKILNERDKDGPKEVEGTPPGQGEGPAEMVLNCEKKLGWGAQLGVAPIQVCVPQKRKRDEEPIGQKKRANEKKFGDWKLRSRGTGVSNGRAKTGRRAKIDGTKEGGRAAGLLKKQRKGGGEKKKRRNGPAKKRASNSEGHRSECHEQK